MKKLLMAMIMTMVMMAMANAKSATTSYSYIDVVTDFEDIHNIVKETIYSSEEQALDANYVIDCADMLSFIDENISSMLSNINYLERKDSLNDSVKSVLEQNKKAVKDLQEWRVLAKKVVKIGNKKLRGKAKPEEITEYCGAVARLQAVKMLKKYSCSDKYNVLKK